MRETTQTDELDWQLREQAAVVGGSGSTGSRGDASLGEMVEDCD